MNGSVTERQIWKWRISWLCGCCWLANRKLSHFFAQTHTTFIYCPLPWRWKRNAGTCHRQNDNNNNLFPSSLSLFANDDNRRDTTTFIHNFYFQTIPFRHPNPVPYRVLRCSSRSICIMKCLWLCLLCAAECMHFLISHTENRETPFIRRHTHIMYKWNDLIHVTASAECNRQLRRQGIAIFTFSHFHFWLSLAVWLLRNDDDDDKDDGRAAAPITSTTYIMWSSVCVWAIVWY